MAVKRAKRKRKRRARAAKGHAKPRRRNQRSRKGAKKRAAKSRDSKKQSVRPSRRRSDNAKRKADKRVRPSQRIPSPPDHEPIQADTAPLDYDEEDIEEYAALWGVSYEEAEAVLEESTDVFANVPLDDYGRPDIDYMTDLADMFDVEVSDMYDLYYGCSPGSSE